MTPAEALRDVRGYASAGRVRFSAHARVRMAKRSALVVDVIHALVHATGCKAAERDRWRVTGEDLDGEELIAIVVLDDGILVVTMF